MIKSILIAADNSKSGKAAIATGIKFAKSIGAKVKCLYVEDILRLLAWQPTELIGAAITASPVISQGRPTLEQVEVEKEFIQEAKALKDIFNFNKKELGVEGDFIVIRGKIDDEIASAAKRVDMVVIGRRGSTTYPLNISEPGPTAENLLRTTTRPVMVVPPDAKFGNKTLIAYDGSSTAQRALTTAAQVTTALKGEIAIISIANDIDTAEKPLSDAKEYISHYGLKATYKIGFGSAMPWKEIMDEAQRFEPGLIVMGAYGENRLLELIFGSTTRQVLMNATCPVLLCR